ncbi:MAG: hypothetical protein L3J37_02250 [Rhodobacteraceae bacterium]|nr:hypothetical protein [Paracoccaceae bacterium]
MRAITTTLFLLLGLVLAGCANPNAGTAPAEQIAASRYANSEPAYISLITTTNSRSDFGEHSALLINGSQQIIYDPAGSFRHSQLPRRDDVVYGITPRYADYYNSYHARFGYYVTVQKLEISREQADAMIAASIERGSVPKLWCATAIADVLNDFPQFAKIRPTFFPGAIMKRFADIPGVETTFVREDDVGQNYRLD